MKIHDPFNTLVHFLEIQSNKIYRIISLIILFEHLHGTSQFIEEGLNLHDRNHKKITNRAYSGCLI